MAGKTMQSTIEIAGVLSPSLQAAIKNAVGKLEEMSEKTLASAGAAEKLTADIAAQESVLNSLQKGYADFVVSGKESSDEAQTLAAQIQKVSNELGENEGTLKAAQEAARKLADTQDDTADSYTKLERKISSQETELSALRREYANVVLEQGESSDEAKKLANRIEDLSGELKENKEKLSDAEKSADELGKSLADTGDAAKKTENKLADLAKHGLAAFAKAAAKAAAVATAAAGTAVVALSKKAIESYANYEQLAGGVDTLFGTGGKAFDEYAASFGNMSVEEIKAFQKANDLAVDGIVGPQTMAAIQSSYDKLADAPKTVMQNAENAWSTAGLSANDYMETVTSFSASLISSLGGDTAKAAEYADKAIVDMSDNANKMGTDMASIQNAYQSFAKQNFGMLDNLKLGYGGTKEEMERLLEDAEKLSGVEYDISSYADIVEAIHKIQESMGIAGATSDEAEKTISGSLNAMKAAWENTLTALIRGGDDFDKCIDNLVKSAKTFGKNIMPAIVKALGGIGELIEELAPIVEAELPGLVDTLLPPLIKATTSLVKALIVALPGIIGAIVDEIPEILGEIGEAIVETFGDIPGFGKVEDFFGGLADFFEKNSSTIKKIIPSALIILGGLKIFSKLKGLGSIFGKSGGEKSGGGILSAFKALAETNTDVILKGMANIGIIVAGLGALVAAVAFVAPYITSLCDSGQFAKLMIAIGIVGILGTKMAELAGKVGDIPVATVSKGLANVAIIMAGLGALTTVIAWVAPHVTSLCDSGTFLKLIAAISIVGVVGSAMAGLAGVVGTIPVPVVLNGLADIALAIGGITAVIEAFGLLSKIPGFNEFLESGGTVLAKIFGVIGECAGTLVSGIGVGLTSGLEEIGTNIAAFATSVEPAIAAFSGMDAAGLSEFASAFGDFVLVMVGDKLLSLITGGTDYAALGTNLTSFTTNAAGFFTAVSGISEDTLTKASNLFTCLAGLEGLPKEGGIVSWFTGETDYSKISTGVTQLAEAAGSFVLLQDIPETAFTNATNLFNCLADVSALPKEGGIFQWFTGDIAFDSLASGLAALTSGEMISAYTTLSGFSADSFSGLSALFAALGSVSALPKEGGIFQWFTGDSSAGLNSVASQLPGVATNIESFFTNIGGRTDFTPIKSLFDTLSSIEINSDAAETGFWSGTSQMQEMGQGLSDFATSASTFFSSINGFDVEKMKSFFSELSTVGSLPEALTSLDASVGTSIGNIVTTADTKMGEVKTALETSMDSAVSTTESKFTSIYNTISNKMSGAVTAVQNAVASMQSAFNFSWSIPDLKLPHLSVSGNFSINPPSVPSFGVSWYKEGGILTQPTVFGAAGNTLLAGGEAGAEAVVPLKMLWDNLEKMIREVFNNANSAGGITDTGLTSKAGELLTLDNFSLGSLADGTNVVIYYDFSNFTWSPQIQGGTGNDEDDLMARLRAHEAEFFDWLEEFIKMREVAQYA